MDNSTDANKQGAQDAPNTAAQFGQLTGQINGSYWWPCRCERCPCCGGYRTYQGQPYITWTSQPMGNWAGQREP